MFNRFHQFSRYNTNHTLKNLLKFPTTRHSSSLQAVPPTATLKSVKTRTLQRLGLDYLESADDQICYYNLSYGELADHQARNREGFFASNGAFVVDTGKFTGRSPMDKYLVKGPSTKDNVWWGEINQAMEPETFTKLYDKALKHYKTNVKTVYVFDGYCGASKESRRKIRFITEKAWHQHFVANMFIKAPPEELENFEPDFTVINCYGLTEEKWKQKGLNSEVFVSFNIKKKIGIIGGAWYGGEMKKGIFSLMHYWLPMENTLSMHCSANVGIERNDVCLFFGLSGTGKTTLSTDKYRRLIGDDEHGWDDKGIFNFEGGCYAKTQNLSMDTEPEIYEAIKANALLENVWIDPETRDPDYFNLTMTENGRVSYPIEHIKNREPTLSGKHPEYIIFLCCDAFGVMPPIAKLNSGQAMYHFISGYTAKVAGTERGIKEPIASFSPCYGAAFLTLHPMKYADLFKQKLEKHNVDCYLVNTGWTSGPYGVGKRMSIKTTRTCIDSIFNGNIKKSTFRKDPIFGFEVPNQIEGVESQILEPRNTWENKDDYDKQYKHLGELFAKNIDKYADPKVYAPFGPTNLEKKSN